MPIILTRFRGDNPMPLNTLSRRKFLALAGLGTAGLTAGASLAACIQSPSVVPATVPTPMPGMDDTAMPGMGSPVSPTSAADANAAMDASMKQGVDTFVANIGQDDAFWHRSLAFTLDGDVKVF